MKTGRIIALVLLLCAIVSANGQSPDLAAIAANPAESRPLVLAEPCPYSVDDVDQAFSACRQLLRTGQTSLGIRVNLGALYLLKARLHADESGNFEKAIDQFTIVLLKDPENETVLAYLRDPSVILKYKTHIGQDGIDNLVRILRPETGTSPGASRLETLACLLNLGGNSEEAAKVAGQLAGLQPDAHADLLAGVSLLRTHDLNGAMKAFHSVIASSSIPDDVLTARLGLAQASLEDNNPDQADSLLADIMFQPRLPGLADVWSLTRPADLEWQLGMAFAQRGDADKAFCYLGERTGETIIQAAIKANDNGDKKRALNLFLAALQVPNDQEADCMWAVGVLSLNLDKYTDAVWALEQSRDMGKEFDSRTCIELGIACLALGEYQKAYDVLESARQKFPDDLNIRGWRVAAAFGVGGWDKALAACEEAPPAMGPSDNTRDVTYRLVSGVFSDLDQRAQRAGLDYPRLKHLSALNELYSHFAPYWAEQVRRAKWNVTWEAINLYRSLPLKPVPPRRAIEQESVAERGIQSGQIDDKVSNAAIAATEIAPWWPEARYNLGCLLRDSYYTINLTYLDTEFDKTQMASQEFIFYLHLDPNGAQAAAVRQQLKKWGEKY